MEDFESIRADFPVLRRRVYGKPLVYLDNAATSQKPQAVIDALMDYYSRYNANIHRAIHALGEEATAAYELAREKVRAFINAPAVESIVFVRNTTEAINLVAYAWGRRNLHQGDNIVLTQMEHHSNLVPWILLAQEKGAELRYVEISLEDHTLKAEQLRDLIDARTRLVAMGKVSNSLGTINPVEMAAELAHAVGARMLVDGAQSVPHMPTDVQAMGCDFLAFSGHKMMAPTGVGVLYAPVELLEEMDPFLGGGEMIREVFWDRATWNEVPWKYEAGTPNIADVIGLGAAVDYLVQLGMERVRSHEVKLTGYALDVLHSRFDDIILYGPPEAERRSGVVSFNFPDIHPHDLGTVVDRHGVAIRAGHHCTQPLMRCLGVSGTVRASFYVYNTRDEVDILADALWQAKAYFGDVVSRA